MPTAAVPPGDGVAGDAGAVPALAATLGAAAAGTIAEDDAIPRAGSVTADARGLRRSTTSPTSRTSAIALDVPNCAAHFLRRKYVSAGVLAIAAWRDTAARAAAI